MSGPTRAYKDGHMPDDSAFRWSSDAKLGEGAF